MKTHNPFLQGSSTEPTDQELVRLTTTGDRGALESLLARHQPWIYNIAFRMVMKPEDAEDITQEILIKILTKLSSFNPEKASFRTWLYRVVANHVINMKTRGYEAAITDIEKYYDGINAVPDQDPDASPEIQMAIADITISCVMGVLLCLERKQRLAFILAIGFNVSDAQGSEILQMSRAAFRKTLSRAREKLYQYMSKSCGVINPEANCRCSQKVMGFIQSGSYQPNNFVFLQNESPKIEEIVGDTMERFSKEIFPEYAQLIRKQPFYQAPEITLWLRDLVEKREFKEIFNLD